MLTTNNNLTQQCTCLNRLGQHIQIRKAYNFLIWIGLVAYLGNCTENLLTRLPPGERTAECNVQARMIDGMQDELKARKLVLQSQLEIATMITGAAAP